MTINSITADINRFLTRHLRAYRICVIIALIAIIITLIIK